MWAFDVRYVRPRDQEREERIAAVAAQYGGTLLDVDETMVSGDINTVCLTFEFGDKKSAEIGYKAVAASGEHVEGPYSY
jgi:hypothetical protein